VCVLGGCDSSSWPVARPLIGWAVGGIADGFGTIIHTADGAATWDRQGSATTIPNVTISGVSAVDTQNVWVVGDQSDGYGVILHTTDGGQTWVRQGGPEDIPDAALGGVSAVDAETAWVAGKPGAVLLTTDGGQTWQQKDTGYPDANFAAITAADRDTAWAVGSNGEGGNEHILIVKTTDGGASWSPQGTRSALGSSALIDAHAASATVAWGVGTEFTVAYTSTGGATWANLPPGPSWYHLNGVCAIGTETAWVAADYNVVLRTTDAGRTWDHFAPPTRHGTSYMLGVSAADANTACVVGADMEHANDEAVIVYTTDGGANWTEATSPANAELRRVSFAGAAR
jgi:photosystem II stability/assembly factor-like uncharacterized protein